MNKDNLIYIVDDEPDILELLILQLTKVGFTVEGFEDGKSLLTKLNSTVPNLLLLDLMLPDIEGTEICKILKKEKRYEKMPIIMLTAKGEEIDKIVGLELGADDYITKPFSTRELIARIKAVLRRTTTFNTNSDFVNIGNLLQIDKRKFEIKIKGEKVNLTTTEFKILELLISHQGWVYSREQILNHLWGKEKIVLDRTIDVHIRNLRSKIGEVSDYIINIRGIGYKFEV
ncbi:MAG: hypothetical protein B6226_05845 [Candidatus Cloacimonetes bacterium 4572_65]|nr:MAG: hypothetical protein B6226_05845 [Candidatus Cloacimonetes bacterium 4572_65]